MASDSTGWPVLEDRLPLARLRHPGRRGKRSRPAWPLAVLAFVCGGLISAAVFTIGWRHQAQRNTAAETALARSTAHVHSLQGRVSSLTASLAAARAAEARDRHAAAAARAAAKAVSSAAATVAAQASASDRSARSVSSAAGGVTSAVGKIASELKTLTTYLTTTPTRQLDAGYVASQASYLEEQLSRLQSSGGGLDDAVTSFGAAVQKVARLAAELSSSR